MTWSEMTVIEPALKLLEREIVSFVKTDKPSGTELSRAWYWPNGYKQRLYALAGWGAYEEPLRTSEAYDIAYQRLGKKLGIL